MDPIDTSFMVIVSAFLIFGVGGLVVFLILTIPNVNKKSFYDTKGMGRHNYFYYFLVGVAFITFGILLTRYLMLAIGTFMAIHGLMHKKEWKKNRQELKHLSKERRRLNKFIAIYFAGIAFFLILMYLYLPDDLILLLSEG